MPTPMPDAATETTPEPTIALTPGLLLEAYAAGLFPMAEDRRDRRLFWIDPLRRGVLPLDRFHVPRRLLRTVRRDLYRVSTDLAFAAVIEACAEPQSGRPRTWINDPMIALYAELNRQGHAHSVECWQGAKLVGGLYGVSLGGAFFGESMFSRARDASKVALVHLVARLKVCGYRLLDTQFVTPHLRQFGAVEISRARYRALLASALKHRSNFYCLAPSIPGAVALQSISQTS
jgi:leucyl/phenylalanyl-tRNA--protein transferase